MLNLNSSHWFFTLIVFTKLYIVWHKSFQQQINCTWSTRLACQPLLQSEVHSDSLYSNRDLWDGTLKQSSIFVFSEIFFCRMFLVQNMNKFFFLTNVIFLLGSCLYILVFCSVDIPQPCMKYEVWRKSFPPFYTHKG